MKEIRTFSKKVYVCDNCGAEVSHGWGICSKCGIDICQNCSTRYDFELIKWRSYIGDSYRIELNNLKEGLRATYCPKCVVELEAALVELGFKPFSYEMKPV